MTPIPPAASGVYQIRCIPTGKIYVGSAMELRQRWYAHRGLLRRGNHPNRHLQHAWEKYGENNFEFTVLEFTTPDKLLQVEQEWIDRTSCTDSNTGFNICPTAKALVGLNVQVWEGFIDPDGNEVVITNLHGFCRENGLQVRNMQELASGKSNRRSHKGWTHRNSLHNRERTKVFDGFIDPQGCPVGPIKNLSAFSQEHELDEDSMYDVAKGRSYSYRGWTYQNDRKNRREKTYHGFISPENLRVKITNLRAFCRDNGLNVVQMRNIISGRRKSYRGWTWR